MREVARRAGVAGLVGLFLLLPEIRADAETIRAGDVLRVTFDMNSSVPGHFEFGRLDYFEFVVGLRPLAPIGSFTARLFDRDRLLGTYASAFDRGAISRFISTASIYVGPATIVDFSAFNNGTIGGRIDFTISSGSGTLFRVSDELSIGYAIEPMIGFTSNITTHSFTVLPGEEATPPVPEPATMLLTASGLAGLATLRRRREG